MDVEQIGIHDAARTTASAPSSQSPIKPAHNTHQLPQVTPMRPTFFRSAFPLLAALVLMAVHSASSQSASAFAGNGSAKCLLRAGVSLLLGDIFLQTSPPALRDGSLWGAISMTKACLMRRCQSKMTATSCGGPQCLCELVPGSTSIFVCPPSSNFDDMIEQVFQCTCRIHR